jgi:pimeloyl-ACP methyl ester carboxylesterase
MLAPVAKLPAELRPHLKKFWTHPKFYRALASQIDHLPAGAAEVKAAGGFGAMPLVVVSAEGNAEAQMAAEAARLSSAGAHVVVKNTGHWIQLDQPKAVLDAVMKVLRH